VPALFRVAGGSWNPIVRASGPFLAQVALARDAGVDFISFIARTAGTSGAPIDWEPLDAACRAILAVNRRRSSSRGGERCPGVVARRPIPLRMVYEGGRAGNHASVSDRVYRRDAADHLEKLCRHLVEAFPERLAGVHPCGQNTGSGSTRPPGNLP